MFFSSFDCSVSQAGFPVKSIGHRQDIIPKHITKWTYKKGVGDYPAKGEIILCNVGIYLMDGTQILPYSSSVTKFLYGKEVLIEGLQIVFSHCKKGEVFKVKISSEYAYDDRDDIKLIPPNSSLIFQINFLNTVKQKLQTFGFMDVAQQIRFLIDKSNDEIKKENPEKALQILSQALDITMMLKDVRSPLGQKILVKMVNILVSQKQEERAIELLNEFNPKLERFFLVTNCKIKIYESQGRLKELSDEMKRKFIKYQYNENARKVIGEYCIKANCLEDFKMLEQNAAKNQLRFAYDDDMTSFYPPGIRALISQTPYLKNLTNSAQNQPSKFFPYKTQNFRWNEYRKSRIAIVKKIHEQKPQTSKQQSHIKITFPNPEIKHNLQQPKDTLGKDVKDLKEVQIIKSPLILRKSMNKIIDQKIQPDVKSVTSLMEPVHVFIEPQEKSPEFKLHSLKQLPDRISKQKQTAFRKTFCSSFQKPNKNRSLETKAQQRRPPTSNLESYRPVTRIRKVSNIGQESNSNFLAKYEIIKQLGKGTYGTVYLAKVIKKKDLLPNLFNTFFFNTSNLLTNQSEIKRTIENSKQDSVHYFSVLTDNGSIVNEVSKLLPNEVNNQEGSLLQMETIAQSTLNKASILPNRDDHQLEVSHLEEDEPKKSEKTKIMERSDAQNVQESQINPTENKNQRLETEIFDQDDQLVAIKVYEKFKMNKDPAKFKNIRKEITIMQNLKHQGVIRLYESVQSITKISLVVEYGGEMSLLDYLKKNYPLSPQKLKEFSRQLLKTVIYLHDKNIVHRDIKPQNILVKFNKSTGQESLKLIDYGFSTLTNKTRKLNVICGTPNFMAPELLSSKEYFGEKADVWSYGVVIFVMGQGRHPFKSSEYQELTRLVNKGKFVFKKKHQPAFEQFINQILKVNSDQRPTAVQISKFKWLLQQ